MGELLAQTFEDYTLEAKSVSCRKGDAVLLSDVSFSIAPGNIIWLRGENGIGKTTLLKSIAGLSRPESGQIEFKWHSTMSQASNMVGYQGHNDALKKALPAERELRFWGSIFGTLGLTQEAFSYVGLADKKHVPCGQLSAGQKRRLALARLILSNKPIWVMDEPSAAIDKAGSDLLKATINLHVSRGGAAIIASHAEPVKLGPQTQIMTLRAAS